MFDLCGFPASYEEKYQYPTLEPLLCPDRS
jgi:hypothetical protein